MPATAGDGCDQTCKTEDGYMCYGGTSTTPDKCVRATYTEILYINTTGHNNVIVEFTDEISVKAPLVAADFDLEIITHNGTYQPLSFVVPNDDYYYLPSRTLVLQIFNDNITGIS